MCVFHRRVFHRRVCDRWRSKAFFELYSDGGIIHIKGVTIGIIIVCTAIIIIIIIIYNVGMCGSIPSRNRTVVCIYWYRGWYCYVVGKELGEHGSQLFLFLLPSWAIVWMYVFVITMKGIVGTSIRRRRSSAVIIMIGGISSGCVRRGLN